MEELDDPSGHPVRIGVHIGPNTHSKNGSIRPIRRRRRRDRLAGALGGATTTQVCAGGRGLALRKRRDLRPLRTINVGARC